jgi:hypothetical protein
MLHATKGQPPQPAHLPYPLRRDTKPRAVYPEGVSTQWPIGLTLDGDRPCERCQTLPRDGACNKPGCPR